MPKGLILVAEDDEPSLDILQFLLEKWGYEVITAGNGKDALALTMQKQPDLVLSDVMMPYMSGYELCNEIKSHFSDRFIPVILITAKSDLDSKLTGLNLGADDYLSKPYSHTELEARIRSLFRIKELHDELSKRNKELLEVNQKLQRSLKENQELQRELEIKNKQLLKLSRHDDLTTLFNRRTFYEILDNEFARARRYKLPLSAILLDIDHFKLVNDTYGHLAGDYVLSKVGKIIKKNSRQNDVTARYGGEEFIMLLPSTAPDQAMIVAERIRAEIEATDFQFTDRNIKLTISCGVGGVHESDEEKSLFISAVDEQLYRAKESGRNCICLRPSN